MRSARYIFGIIGGACVALFGGSIIFLVLALASMVDPDLAVEKQRSEFYAKMTANGYWYVVALGIFVLGCGTLAMIWGLANLLRNVCERSPKSPATLDPLDA